MNIKQVLRPDLQQQVSTAERKPGKKATSPVVKGSTDRAAWSKQALAFVEEQNRIMWEKKPGQEESSSMLDSLEKELKTQDKCLKIAMSIIKGDKVPPEDLEYLAKTDPKAYMMAIAMRREKPDPKKVKSVLDEEDRNGGAEEAGGSGEGGGSAAAAAGGSAPAGGASAGGGGDAPAGGGSGEA